MYVKFTKSFLLYRVVYIFLLICNELRKFNFKVIMFDIKKNEYTLIYSFFFNFDWFKSISTGKETLQKPILEKS